MDVIVAILVSLILAGGNIKYITEIIKGAVEPTKSTWIIFCVSTGLNVASFLTNKFDLVSGAYGITDFILCLVILFFSLYCARRQKIYFKNFEKYYLLAAASCVLFWLVSKNPFTTNLFVQLLITIGCIPTIHNILSAKKSNESKMAWAIWLSGSLLSVYPALANHNTLAIIYSLRSSLVCLVILLLTLKFQPQKIK